MKNKFIAYSAAAVIAFTTLPINAAPAVKINLNGNNLSCNSVIRNDRTLVPFRSVLESCGADVSWDGSTSTATATLGGKTVSVQIGSNKVTTGNGSFNTDACAELIDGCTYVPIRAMLEALGINVGWNGVTGTVIIDTNCGNGSVDKPSTNAPDNNDSVDKPSTDAPDNNDSVDKPSTDNGNTDAPSTPEVKPEASTTAQQLLNLVNAERAKQGLNALTYDYSLEAVAYAHSKDMADNNYFSHNSLNGQTPFDRLKNAGISYRAAAENIAAGQKTVEAVFNSWMNSSGHRANILNPNVTKMGLGVYNGGSYGIYWTQLFIG